MRLEEGGNYEKEVLFINFNAFMEKILQELFSFELKLKLII